jgi:hypothetical protein
VTTVGYGDYSFRGEPGWLVVFAILLMMSGALFVAVFFALVANMLVSRSIEESLGRQKITVLRGHVLVIGLGTVGLRVVRQLRDAGREVVVDAARGARVRPAVHRVRGRRADQRRPGQP